MAAIIKKYVTPEPADLLAGRSNLAFNHKGNMLLRSRIVEHLDEYKNCGSRKKKSCIIQRVTKQMSAEGGRFLRQDKESGQWYDAGFKEAHVKISHSFRDAVIPNKVKCLSTLKVSTKTKVKVFSRKYRKEKGIELLPDSPVSLPSQPVAWKPTMTFRRLSVGHLDDLLSYNGDFSQSSISGDDSSLDSCDIVAEELRAARFDDSRCLYGVEPDNPTLQQGSEIFLNNDIRNTSIHPEYVRSDQTSLYARLSSAFYEEHANSDQTVLYNPLSSAFHEESVKSDQAALYDHLSSAFYDVSKTISEAEHYRGEEIESRVLAQLTDDETEQHLSHLPLANLKSPVLDEVLDDLDIDDFSW